MNPVAAVIAVTPMPIPMIADSNGRPAAISEPKVISRTTAATPMPITSVRLCSSCDLHGVTAVLDREAGRARRLDRGGHRFLRLGRHLLGADVVRHLGVAGAAVGRDRLGGKGIQDSGHLRRAGDPVQGLAHLRGVGRVRELLALGRLEDDPGRPRVGAGLREPLVEQVGRTLRLGPRDREGVGRRAGQSGRTGDTRGEQTKPYQHHQPAPAEREPAEPVEEGSHAADRSGRPL